MHDNGTDACRVCGVCDLFLDLGQSWYQTREHDAAMAFSTQSSGLVDSSPLTALIGAMGCALLHGASVAAAAAPPAEHGAGAEGPESPSTAVPDGIWPAMHGRFVILHLRDGTDATGQLVGLYIDSVKLVQADGSPLVIQKGDVASLGLTEGAPPPPTRAGATAKPTLPAPEEAEARGFHKPGGYVVLAAGVGGQFYTYGKGDTYRYATPEWGLGAGWYFGSRRIVAAAGLALQHAATRTTIDGHDIRVNLVHVGPEARFGGGNERLFAYGLVDIHVLADVRYGGAGPATKRLTTGGVGGTLGVGIQRLFPSRFLLGTEFRLPITREFEDSDEHYIYPASTILAPSIRVVLGAKF